MLTVKHPRSPGWLNRAANPSGGSNLRAPFDPLEAQRKTTGPATITTPLQIPETAAFWYRPDLGVTLTSGKVSGWDNQAGTANFSHLAQTNDVRRPVTPTADANFNNQLTMFFDQSVTPLMTFQGTTVSGPAICEMFLVLRLVADPPSSSSRAGGYDYGADTAQEYLPFNVDGKIYEQFGTTAFKTTVNPAPSMATPRVYNVVTKSGGYTTRLDGTQLYTTATNTVGWRATVYFGTSAFAAYLNGYVADWFGYTQEVSVASRLLLTGYVNTRYGLAIASL